MEKEEEAKEEYNPTNGRVSEVAKTLIRCQQAAAQHGKLPGKLFDGAMDGDG